MAKQSLASAYVQIIPSADGISGSLAEALGGEAATAGKSSGASLGASLVSSLKGFLAAAGIGAMLKSAFTGGTEFETALAKVGTIADTAAVPLDTLQSQIMEVSNTMGVGAADIAEATYQTISAGQSTGDAVAFAGQASMLAAAGFTSSASAVDILTTALNAYGLGADEAGHVSDVLLTTQNLGKTSVDELSSSMGKVIPLASAYNVSLENLSSGLAIMTANGIATAEATTYTKSMLNELGDTGSAVSKILQSETGQSFAQLMDSGASLGDVLQTLYNSVDGDSTAFAGLWSSVEAGTGALSLANAGAEKFNDVLGQMQADSNLTETAYATMTDTMQHSMDLLQTSAQNLGIALFDSVSGQLAYLAGPLEPETIPYNRAGTFALDFGCKPQRFLKSGEDVLTVVSGGKLYNPTGCAALPLIRLTLTGDAKLNVGGVQMSVAGHTGPMWIDCDLQDAYYNNTNLNKYLTAPEFPVLGAGATQVSWSGGIDKCEVVPRWWRL